MICLRTLHKWEGSKGIFALSYPGVLQIEEYTMTLLVDLPWDAARKKELMDYLNQEKKFSGIGIKVEDLAGRSDNIWERETWAGRRGPSDSVKRHVMEGFTATKFLKILERGQEALERGEEKEKNCIWERPEDFDYGIDLSVMNHILKCFYESEPPFVMGYYNYKRRFTAWKDGYFYSLENVASYMLDKEVELSLK